MKQFIFTGLLAFTSFVSYAQSVYDSFLTEGKVWTLRHIASEVDPGGYVKYLFEEMKLEGEAVIDGIRFREVVSRYNLYDEPFPEKWTSTNLFLGEDGGKVYVKDNERIFETMDFTMKEGETKDFDIGPKAVSFLFM